MSNCICQIFNKEIIGIGFFCKFDGKKAIITSYETLDEDYFIYNNNINFSIGDYNQKITLYIDIKRQVYCSKENNMTIIELKNEDFINYLVELDENIYNDINEIKTIFEKESIYILHYLNNNSPTVSYGIIDNIDNDNIYNTCYIKSGVKWAPILNVNNNKVIGIWMKNKENINNKGNFFTQLWFSIYQFSLGQQIPVKKIIDNMEPTNNFIINNIRNENIIFMKGFKDLSNNNYEEELKPRRKMNVIVRHVTDYTTNIIMYYGETIDQLLKKCIIQFNVLLGDYKLNLKDSNRFFFMYNAKELKFGDKTKVEEFFKNLINPKIIFNDGGTMGIISHFKMDIIFKISYGITHVFKYYDYSRYGDPISRVLKYYLTAIKRADIINDKNNTICFLYNAKKLKFDDKTLVSILFNCIEGKTIPTPTIIVVDPNNSLLPIND